MSTLKDRPDIMMEVIAVLVKRLGGSVSIDPETDMPKAEYDIMSKFDMENRKLHIVVSEGEEMQIFGTS